MTKYFLRDTPLAGLERQMMTPPHFSPRGGGQMILCRFRYRPEDVACKHCTKYRRKQCTMPVCPWIEERAEAGAVTYSSLAADYYRNWQSGRLGERIAELLSNKKAVAYASKQELERAILEHHYTQIVEDAPPPVPQNTPPAGGMAQARDRRPHGRPQRNPDLRTGMEGK